MTTQCNELCKIARTLNSTAISKYVTLKMMDVPSKHVWKIKESCYVYTKISGYRKIKITNNFFAAKFVSFDEAEGTLNVVLFF